MGIGQAKVVYELTDEVLERVVDKKLSKLVLAAFLNRYDNILVGVKDIAHFHNVTTHTVTNYIKDGLIVPEVKVSENEHPKFRMSYALTLDFKELQKQLRAKNRGY